MSEFQPPIRKRFIDSAQDLQVQADWRWEHEVVSHLLTRFNVAKAKWELINAEEEFSGQRRLTLNSFYRRFPAFPVYLLSQAVYRVKDDVSISRLFTRFGRTKLYDLYCDHSDGVPMDYQDCSYGLVVRWPYVKNGFIVHNYTTADLFREGMRLIYCQEEQRLILESFDSFLDMFPDLDMDQA